MKAVETLPEGYHEYYSLDLQKDKKTAVLVNALAVLIMLAMFVPMILVIPLSESFRLDTGTILRLAVLVVSLIVYIVLHELVHGIAMKSCGTKKVKYGFTALYAFAGSDDYYDKSAYIYIALAPVALFGILLAVVTPLVPRAWFWVVYFIQIMNLSGAAGDLYVTVKFSRFPKDILIRDHGVGMTVFSKELN